MLREHGELQVPCSAANELLRALYEPLPRPHIEAPPELRVEEVRTTPRPSLSLRKAAQRRYGPDGVLHGEVRFEYGDTVLAAFADEATALNGNPARASR